MSNANSHAHTNTNTKSGNTVVEKDETLAMAINSLDMPLPIVGDDGKVVGWFSSLYNYNVRIAKKVLYATPLIATVALLIFGGIKGYEAYQRKD